MKRLAYLASQFPELHETFITREVVALKVAGIPLRLYSLKRCRDRIVHPEAAPLAAETVYLPLSDGRVWMRALGELLRHPLRAASTLGWVLCHHGWPPTDTVKAVAVWVQALALARRMRQDGITHLHAHWATMPTTAAVIASRWLGIPFSFTAHAWDIFVPNPSLAAKLRLAERVITCTDYNRRHLAEVCPEAADKILLNYHGVDLNKFGKPVRLEAGRLAQAPERRQSTTSPSAFSLQPSASSGLPLLLSVGRLVEAKGFETLLDAYALMRDRGVRFKAVIVGEGPLRNALERQIAARGLTDVVEMKAALPQETLRQLYAGAYAFVLPCVVADNGDRDGIPNVILEAMAMGLPVVSTDLSGIPEAVRDQQTGLLVPSRDPNRLAQGLAHLLQHPEVARTFGERGRQWVATQFDERAHMERLVTVMRELLDSSPAVKILYVIWSLAVGGAERVVSLLARHLDPSSYRPMVACLNDAGQLAGPLEEAGVPVVAMHKQGLADVRVLWRLIRLIHRERIQLVHTHLWGGNLWGRLAARLAGVPMVATEHNTDVWKRPWHFAVDRWLARRTHALVAVSGAVREFYIAHGLPADRVETIPNGIETDRFPAPSRSSLYDTLGWPAETPVFLSIGRLVPAKRHEVFIEVMAAVAGQHPEARGLIVGDGPMRESLERRIRERGLAARVVLAGLRSDVPALLRGARAVVFTSEREGLPMVLLEAMASAVPVVACAVGGIPEVLEDGRTGWLVTPQDTAALIERLRHLATHPDTARRVGLAAQADVQKRWSIKAMVEPHEILYRRALRPPARLVYIIDHLDVGGAQRQLLELVRRIPRGRFAPSVVSLSSRRLALAGQFREAGIPVEMIDQAGTWSWHGLWALLRHLRAQRPAIVHTWLFTADLYGRLAAWLSGVPVIVSAVRSIDAWKPSHYVAADRLLRYVTDAFTVNADAIGATLIVRERVARERIHTIYNGVDLEAFDPLRTNGALRRRLALGEAAPLIGIVGRLAPEKDHATFLRAAAIVAREWPAAMFLVVGGGPLRQELGTLARALGLEGRLQFLDPPSDLAEVFAALDLVAVTSHYEGCCNVILEGMAMRKPVIATEVGGNPELVAPGTTGLLVPVGDPDRLAQAIVELLRRPDRRAMGEAARRRIEERFSMPRMVEQTAALYTRLLRQHGMVTP